MNDEAGVPADDRGLAYGDGCFETLRIAHGTAPLATRHLARLQTGAQRLGIEVDALRIPETLTRALADGPPHGVLKLVLTRGSGGAGYRLPLKPLPRLLIRRTALPQPCQRVRDQGLALHLCDIRLATQPALAGIKHLNRLEQVLARAEVDRAGADEGLLLDQTGRPVELTAMNLFVRFADQLWTPPLEDCGVAGVMRGYLLDTLIPREALSVRVGHLPLSRLREADEVFACNSVAGVLPVRKLGLWQWPVGGLTRRLQQSVDELWQ